jgi:hypothetical protein
VCCWDGPECLVIHAKFHRNWFGCSKVDGGRIHRQHGEITSSLLFFKIMNVSSGLENRYYGLGDLQRWLCDTPLSAKKLELTSPTSGSNSVVYFACGLRTRSLFVYGSMLESVCGLVVRFRNYRSRGPGFDSLHYQIFREVMGLERDPLSLVSTIEELLERKSSGSGLENREYGLKDAQRWPHGTLYPQKLSLTPTASGDCSVGIVRSRTK